jgi:glycerophosphoryl diester phosphodiesterase
MMDRKTFLRPYAHRGLHAKKRGIVENTAPAFAAAMDKGYGIECDLRPAAEGVPIVFHDETLNRLVDGRSPVAALTAHDLKRLSYRGSDVRLQTFAELLDQVDGKVPLLVEIKSEWDAPDPIFLKRVARLASAYKSPVALMSFDPDVMAMIKEFAPGVPRGIVSGSYAGAGWWNRKLSRQRAADLRNLLESGPVAPDFYAYEVGALPTPVTEFVRHVLGLPLFTWTVRTAKDRVAAAKWADAMIFEGFEP